MRPRKLEDAEIAAFLAAEKGWERRGEALRKTFRFAGYPETIAFVTKVALAAERRDHHPDLVVKWGSVEVTWSTHDAGGITSLDLELAKRSDELAR